MRPLVAVSLSAIFIGLVAGGLVGCHTAHKGAEKPVMVQVEMPQGSDQVLEEAKTMLRLDDYQAFEKAEFRFLALRFWRKEDVQIAGWLAQLYVAWAEQLKNEVDFLRLKSAASKAMERRTDWNALSTLVDYRLNKLAEVEEQARQTCNMLITYHGSDYISHRVMADYYRMMEDREPMNDQLMMLRKQNPDSVGLAFLEGAAVAQFDHDYMGALAHYDRALKMDPRFTKALYFKGLAQHYMGDATAAVATMKGVLELSPQHPGARAYLSAAAYLADLSDEARKRLSVAQAASVEPSGHPKLIYWVGQWVEDSPRLSWRLSGPPQAATQVKMTVSLVENGDNVLDTKEKIVELKSNGFLGGTETFSLDKRRKDAFYHLIVHLASRENGQGEYSTISIQKAELPTTP